MGMPGMMGVDSVDSSNRQNATKNRIDKGVAGRSMMAKNGRSRCEDPVGQRPALEALRGVERVLRPGAVWADARRRGSRRRVYARKFAGETSGDWGCTGDACCGIGTAMEGEGAQSSRGGLARGEGTQLGGGRRCCGEAWAGEVVVVEGWQQL
jgi:hypothetical protein